MKKSQTAVLFIAILLASLLVACGQKTKGGTDQISLVPETANMIGHVELGQIIGDADIAEVYAALPKQVGDPQTIEEVLATAMDMSNLDLSDFEEGWVFSDISLAASDNAYYGAILKGTFEESSLLASVFSEGEWFESIDYLGCRISTGSDQEAGLAVLASDLLVVGSVPAIKDVIAVREGNMPAVGGDLLKKYDSLGAALVKVAAAMPPGLMEQELQDLTAGISSPPALDALADVQIASMSMAKHGQSIACNSHLFFSDSQSASDVRGLIPLVPLMVGSIEIPGGSIIENPERFLALLPGLLAKSDFQTKGSCLTISSDLNAADIQAMSATAGPSGLGITMAVNMGSLTSSGLGVSIDAAISNYIGLKFDIADMRLAATMNGQTFTEKTIAGSSIAANSTARFQHDLVIPLELLGERDMLITIETTAEARGLSMPLNAAIALTTPDLKSLVIPEIDLGVDFGELAADGLHTGLQANLSNPNPFGIDVGDLQITAKGQAGNVIFTSNMKGCSLGPDSTGKLSGDLLLPLEVITEPNIVISVQTQAGFAGITLPINARVTADVPDIESLITVPDMDLAVGFGEPTSDGLLMGLQTTITNSNPFGVDVGDLQIVAKDQAGNVILTSNMKGCSVGPDSTGMLSGNLLLPLEVISEPTIVVTVQTQAGFAGVTLPIDAKVRVNMPDISSLIVPEIDLGVDFGELTSSGLHMGLRTTITNSNAFGIDVGDLQIVARGQAGNVILTSNMKGCSIGPDSTGTISGDILMPLEVLNESSIVISVQTQAGCAGVVLPINAKVTVKMPDIGSLITVPGIEMYTEPSLVSGFPLPGLHVVVASTITNDSDIDLIVDDIQVTFFDSDGKLVEGMTVPGGTVRAHSSQELSGSETLSASEYLSLIDGDYFRVKVATEAGISGVQAGIPIETAMTMVLSSLFEVPEMDMGVSFGELSSNGLPVGLQTNVSNSNPFEIDVDDLQILVTGQSGNVILTSILKGCSIGPDSTGTLSGNLLMPLAVLNEPTIVISVLTQSGFAGIIEPVNAKVTLDMPDIESLITVPKIDLGVDFGEITSGGLPMGLQANLSNPNPFGIDVGNLQVLVKGQSGNTILTAIMNGCSIAPNSVGTLSGNLLMPLEILDEPTVTIAIQTQGGFAEITLPILAKVAVNVPDIKSLITVPEIGLGVTFGELTPDGLPMVLQANLSNSNPFGIDIRDLLVVVKDQSGNVILTSNMSGCSLEPNSAGTLSGDLLLPLEVLNQPTIVITVQTQAGFAGITLPVSANVILVNLPGIA
jgi:LEA14-like dessication related protein